MADQDRWRDDLDRNRWRDDDRSRSRGEQGRRYETDYDRDRSARRDDGGFGRGSRDYLSGDPRPDEPGYGYRDRGEDDGYGGYSSGYGPYASGRSGRRDDYRGESRFGRDREGFGPGFGQRRDWRELSGRSSSDLAFGRDASGRERPHDDYGRGQGYGREDRGFFERAGDEIASWFGDDDAGRRRSADAREDERQGGHRGRGPKTYQRSDERIRDDVNDRLTDDPRVDASDIDVAVSEREVTLTGTVRNRADKRRAEDVAESVSGVTHVQNNLRVKAETSWSGGSTADTGASTGNELGTGHSGLFSGRSAAAAETSKA